MDAAGWAVRLRDISVDYAGLRALDGVSFDLAPGEAAALVGLSGAGKTSLLNVMTGMVRPSAGTVAVNGCPLDRVSGRRLRAIRAGIGFVHQQAGLIPGLRVIQNVVCGGFGHRSFVGSLRDLLFPASRSVERAYRILDSVGIAAKLFERTDRLSGGELQRVAIARALYQEPRILLADEPVASVDPARAAANIELMRRLCAERGLSLLVSLHNVALAREHFPRLLALRHGRLVADKPMAAVSPAELDDLLRLDERKAVPTPGAAEHAAAPGPRDHEAGAPFR